MKRTILVNRSGLVNLIKEMITESENSKDIELQNLIGKTVRFKMNDLDGNNLGEDVFKILNAEYEIIKTANNKIRAFISLKVSDLKSLKKREISLMVDLLNDKPIVYGFDYNGEEYTTIHYRNSKLEDYLSNMIDKFPIYWHDQEQAPTDF